MMAKNREVLALHRVHPTWTAPQIARVLECDSGYVRATAQRNGIVLPSALPEGDGIRKLGRAVRELGITTVADLKQRLGA